MENKNVINQITDVFKSKEIQNEIKNIMRPFISLILREIYPYIFLSMIFVFISFFLLLGIFILLMKKS